ncbi:hypothetical protein BDP81DRAFT_407202 [Colletotrichum phormii]|uniref:Uncharacterized protein n=1 Tax=Colletotrichum phormii TaxID=359342 RepID=A0AAI9ZRA8_9PEZI|nr:uncharacterized protein BDP81DRAFT_407202 [Colletotrichum phormii]KAK1635553.1 hypothetical protein BDP81DRAFT_407202 [Colletotrichum phormii]
MAVLLARFDGKPIFTWNGVTLNTVVSILSVTMKAAVAFVLSECLAQWKWILFTREDRPLIDFDRIDAATRGPLGSLRILSRTRGAYAVQLGAILTLLAVGLDPLAQQIIQVREDVVYTGSTQTDKGPLALNSGTNVYSDDKYPTTSYGTGIPSKTNSMKDIDTLLWSMNTIHPDMEALNKSTGFTPGESERGSTAGLKLWPDIPMQATERDPDSWIRSPEYEDGQPGNVISKEANGTLEFDRYWSAVPNIELRLEFPNNKSESYYRISEDSVKSMSAHMQELFRTNVSGTLDQREEIEKLLGSDAVGFNGVSFGPYEKLSMKATPPALDNLWTWTRHNITSTFYTLATSMTNEMRRNYAPGQSQNRGIDTDRFQDGSLGNYGKVGKPTVLYHIEWPWIALHGVMLVSATAFSLATLGNSNSRGSVPLWKSSSLAAIRHGRDVGGVLSRSTTMGEFQDTARKPV